MPVFAAGDLRRLGSDLFAAVGVPREEAELVADHMVESGLLGHDSHGVLRYPQYVESVRRGKVVPGAPFEILSEAPRIAHVSGNWNFGPVTAHRAAQLAASKARDGAVAAVTVRSCNHVARLGRFAAQIAASGDLVGMLFCNGHGSDHSTAPFAGAEKRLPTNPLAAAVPSGREWPILLDMTTSMTSGGAMRLYRNRREPVPEGFIIDSGGAPTTDVEKYYAGGALLPLGFPGTGHKGFGLAVAVDILAGALSGAGCSRQDPPEAGNALLIAALNVAAFVPLDEFLERGRSVCAAREVVASRRWIRRGGAAGGEVAPGARAAPARRHAGGRSRPGSRFARSPPSSGWRCRNRCEWIHPVPAGLVRREFDAFAFVRTPACAGGH